MTIKTTSHRINRADHPTFAAIERHRAAETAFLAQCLKEIYATKAGVKLERATGDYRTPGMIAVVNEAIAARVALANTVPTTPAGLIALLTYARDNSPAIFEGEAAYFFDGDAEQVAHARSVEIAVRGMAGEL